MDGILYKKKWQKNMSVHSLFSNRVIVLSGMGEGRHGFLVMAHLHCMGLETGLGTMGLYIVHLNVHTTQG